MSDILQVYSDYTNYTDLLFAALSGLPIGMQQSLALSSCFLVHILCITQLENLVCTIKLVTRTPA